MSRNIPRVKTWVVHYHNDKDGEFARYEVRTINKAFAIWMACEEGMWAYHAQANKVTVSLKKEELNPCKTSNMLCSLS